MYSKLTNSWLKHWDFIVCDLVMIMAAYMFSLMTRSGSSFIENQIYFNIGIVLFLADICGAFFMEPYHGIMRRGYFQEFKSSLKHVVVVAVLESLYLFLSKNGGYFSRLSFLVFVPTALLLVYGARVLWKLYLVRHQRILYKKQKMMLVTTRDDAEETVTHIEKNCFNEFEIIGMAYADETPKSGEKILDVPAVCTADALPDYIQTRWVDAVLISVKKNHRLPAELIDTCIQMGVTVHYRIDELGGREGTQYINRMGGYMVVTSGLRGTSQWQLLVKRLLDVCGGLVGMLITGMLTVFLGPAIYLASPGPIFFSQTRIGRNGKPFKIYKFRSMYMDAEQRKKELMAQNEMQGFMFKMDADPRIIGSGPDGKRHGLGWFIRKTSLDEFPQFWNVLKGDMSLVGTRPPTEDEWQQYEHNHRARLAAKPGLTGMWQVSGRSNITDFEEVVKLDMEYIKSWNFGMDIKILLKTVMVVLTGSGSR